MGLKDRFKHSSLKARLLMGFSTIIALMMLLTAIGVTQVNSIDSSLTTINDVNSVKQRYAIDFRGSVHDRAIALRDVTLVESASALEGVLADIQRLDANYQASARRMAALFAERDDTLAEERQALAEIETIEQRIQPLIAEVIDLRLEGDVAAARQLLLSEAAPAFEAWLAQVNVFIDMQEAMNQQEAIAARTLAGGFQILMLVLCAGATAIALAIASLLTRQLLRELGAEPNQVRAFANAVGRGELASQHTLKKGDTDSIMANLVAMSQQLQQTVSSVRRSADAVASNSEQIAQSNTELSVRTEEQASALTQTASSMEQLGSTVKQNAENARRAEALAGSASRVAEQGGEAVRQMVSTMQDIQRRSHEISEIITLIDGIAFQTNILALNASVEAARAGEHGRGFAVVANEVRQLALRSADAAKQIDTLVSGSVSCVEEGAALAAEAGRTTEEIVASITQVSNFVSEISVASAEQSDGVNQVGEAVTQMDQMTQQNAQLVEEGASAADNLRHQARQLVRAMAVFQLEAQDATVGAGDATAPFAALPESTVPGRPLLAASLR